MFLLTADFYLPSDDAPDVAVEQVAEAICGAFPEAVVDWEEGRRKMAAHVQKLIDSGCPEVIYRRDKSVIDKTLFVSLPVEGFPCRMSGYTSGFSNDLGCISLECHPFDIQALQAGAKTVAERLNLTFNLAGGVEDVSLRIIPVAQSPEQIVEAHFPEEYYEGPNFTVLTDWKSVLISACRLWVQNHPEPRIVENWSQFFSSADQFSMALIERLESIGQIQAVTRVYFGDGKWHSCLVIQYSGWSGILDLAGVPEPLLG
ncbi:MAG: hypothetical protein R3C49_16020 [Planctomycetaceae bacterium]